MKVVVGKEDLAGALRKTLSAVNSKNTIPILHNVMLQSDDEGFSVTATDLEICIRAQAEAQVERPGCTTLPARKLSQIVSVLPEGEVTLETDDNQQTSISCQRSFFKMLGLNPEEFPREQTEEPTWSLTLPAADFKRTLGKVSYAVSHDESRYVLNGTLLSVRSGTLTTVATDGRRLALVEQNLSENEVADFDVILPAKAVSELLKVLEGDEELQIGMTDSQATFTMKNLLLTSKLVEGNYPNYRQVIPAAFSNSAIVQREDFIEVLNRVSMMISESSTTVNMKLEKGLMTVSAVSSEFGEGNEPIDVSYDGEPINISFNPTFIVDPLRHMEADQAVFQFNDEFSPTSISGDEGFLCVVMPMRSS